jgi:bifunctional UDP-N-acetylglucosamine pyrophosphorylase/glucosamine-1-phosphate N-acetyltransferase
MDAMSRRRALSAVVMAAGEGTRMRSTRPKPLHVLCGRPMVLHVLDALAELELDRAVVVVEWGEGVVEPLSDSHLEVHLERRDDDVRVATVQGVGPRWTS